MILTDGREAEDLATAVESGQASADSDRLVDTYQRVVHGFVPLEAPVERILAKSADASIFAMPSRPSRRWLIRLAAIAGTLAVLGLLVLTGKPAAPSAQAVLARALAAVESDEGVLYLKSTERVRGQRQGNVQEAWFDPAHDRFRLRRLENGRVAEEDLETRRTLYQYSPEVKTATVSGLVRPGPAWMFREREDLARALTTLLQSGRATARKERIGDKETLRLEFDPLRAYTRNERLPRMPVEKVVVNVDKDTLMPVRKATYRHSGGDWRLLGELIYKEARRLTGAQVPKGLFSGDFLRDADIEESGLLSLEMAKARQGLKLVYLGERFAGLPLSEISAEPNTRRPDGRPRVWIFYGNPPEDPAGDSGDEPELHIVHRAVTTDPNGAPDSDAADLIKHQATRMLEINGRPAKLVWETDQQSRRRAYLTFVIDRTRVVMSAFDGSRRRLASEPRELLVEAADKLVALN